MTCLLNFTCFGYDIELQWTLQGSSFLSAPTISSSSPTDKTVSTKSEISFEPEWTHHGKNLTCQVWHSAKVLSEESVQLDVKRESPPPCSPGSDDAVLVTSSLMPPEG